MNMGFVLNHGSDDEIQSCLSKYIRRGFKFSETLSRGHLAPSTHSEDAVRNLHDKDVLFLPFNPYTNDIRDFDNAILWELPH